jgi:hypothetical protein
MRQRLFEYAVLVHPTEKEVEEGKSTVIQDEGRLLGTNDQAIILTIAQKLPKELADKIATGLVDIAVRPF